MRLWSALWAVPMVGLCLWLGSASVHAQAPDDERARVHFFAGQSHFEAERWDEAAREFSAAFELSGRPEMLINVSRAHERGGHLTEAIADLEDLLARYPQTSYRPEAEQRIASMRDELAERESAPVPKAVSAPAPPRAPSSAPSARQDSPTTKVWPPRWPTLVAGSSSIAALVAAIATGGKAHAIHNQLESDCPDDTCTSDLADDRRRGQRLARSSTGLSFAAGALAASTVVLWVFDVRAARERIALSMSFQPSLTEARMRVRF